VGDVISGQTELAPVVSLVLVGTFGVVTFGWRVWLQNRRTGSFGVRYSPHTPADWLAGIALVSGVIAAVLAPVADMVGLLRRIEALDHPLGLVVGGTVFVAGFVLTVRAQYDLGDSWRIGVDPEEATTLMTEGVFRFVRNPVFSGITLVFAALVLFVPSVLAAAGWILIAVGLEVQVRWVEEPYLRGLHGARYRAYAAAVGRFIPGVGRLV
jgi:protein-S-isoprenylcysteine O-methyltransferase Ste14